MDQGALEKHTTDTLERLSVIETVQGYQHDTMIRAFQEMDHIRAEMRMRGFGAPLGATGWLQLVVAFLLPFLVLLASGTPPRDAMQKAAMQATSH